MLSHAMESYRVDSDARSLEFASDVSDNQYAVCLH